MPATNSDYPLIRDLWRGALLNTIAHAIWITSDPILAHEVVWDGKTYLRQDTMGASGAIHFADHHTVTGAFFSTRSTSYKPESAYSIAPFLNGIPDDLRTLANNKVLSYLLQEHGGLAQPIITAAFWSANTQLTAAMPWEEVWNNGGYILNIELRPVHSVFDTLQTDLELTSAQLNLLQSLVHKRGNELTETITLDHSEYETLVAQGSAGIAEARELLSAINIQIPHSAAD
ncbi:MAG: hypothetical protein JXA10_14810 [Anaerolineae bacterium]|nr:hypothetical protein [Anaerolineae bacterium]